MWGNQPSNRYRHRNATLQHRISEYRLLRRQRGGLTANARAFDIQQVPRVNHSLTLSLTSLMQFTFDDTPPLNSSGISRTELNQLHQIKLGSAFAEVSPVYVTLYRIYCGGTFNSRGYLLAPNTNQRYAVTYPTVERMFARRISSWIVYHLLFVSSDNPALDIRFYLRYISYIPRGGKRQKPYTKPLTTLHLQD